MYKSDSLIEGVKVKYANNLENPFIRFYSLLCKVIILNSLEGLFIRFYSLRDQNNNSLGSFHVNNPFN